jgi:alanine dehydrogenase
VPLLITQRDFERILSDQRARFLSALIDGIAAGHGEIAAGTEQEHPRIYLRDLNDPERRPPGLFTMSALLAGAGLMGTRLLALGGASKDAGDGMLILFDQHTKRCLAIVADAGLHSYRSGAPAAVAARFLARPDAEEVAVIGSHGIAEGTLAVIHHVRPTVKRVRIYSPTPDHRERFAERMAPALECDVRAVGSAAEAVQGADIVITATDADSPVVPADAIGAGTYIAVLARNEVEQATFARSRIVLSSRSAWDALDPPLREAMPGEAIAGELADLVAGRIGLRYRPDAVTVFAGCAPLAMWDVAAAAATLEVARECGLGTEISLTG